MGMLKIAIAIDRWKLPIFKKHLDRAGYEFKKRPGVTADTMMLRVESKTVDELKPIIQAAQDECARSKLN